MNASELAKWKQRGGASPKVVTLHGLRPDGFHVLEPGRMQYRAQAQSTDWAIHECSGCIFRHQDAAVCREAARLAVLAGMPDCDFGVIYREIETDERQLSLD